MKEWYYVPRTNFRVTFFTGVCCLALVGLELGGIIDNVALLLFMQTV